MMDSSSVSKDTIHQLSTVHLLVATTILYSSTAPWSRPTWSSGPSS